MAAIASVSTTQIEFNSDDEGLFVTIDTERLHIRSVQAKSADYDRYTLLFGDTAVMKTFATGVKKTAEETIERVNLWDRRWRNNDPYSGLAVFRDKDFIGHVVLGHGDRPGESELAYLFHQKYWNQGYGTEAVTALVKEYAPMVAKDYQLGDQPLKRIVATARPDNPASCKILEKVGMKKIGDEVTHGALRHHYAIDLADLQQGTAAKVTDVCDQYLQSA